ncbi:hypothetical protein V6N13_077975 [Hibiscus sabdariffa]
MLLCFSWLWIGSTKPDDVTISIDQSFPLADLNKAQNPGSENRDAGEEEGSDYEDDSDDDDDDDDDGESDDDDEDDDDEDEDDEDEDDDDDEDEDDDDD